MNKIRIMYQGTDVGRIYLEDCGLKKHTSIEHGQTLTLSVTDSLLNSYKNGVIKYFSTVESNEYFRDKPPFSVFIADFRDLKTIYENEKLNALIQNIDCGIAVVCDEDIDIDLFYKCVEAFRDKYMELTKK